MARKFLWGIFFLFLMNSWGVSGTRQNVIYPIVSYFDTVGFMFGVYDVNYDLEGTYQLQAFFLKADSGYLARLSLDDGYITSSLALEGSILQSTLFQSYYGFGNNTQVSSLTNIFGEFSDLELGLRYYLQAQHSLALHYLRNARQEDFQKNGSQIVPNENRSGLQLSYRLDHRDQKPNASSGDYWEISYRYFPSEWTSLSSVDSVSQWVLDGRYFIPWGKNTWAFRNLWGISQSSAALSYLNQFKLGGSRLLRGHNFNRFIGETVNLFQLELRVPLGAPFSVNAFMEAGRVGDFINLQTKYHATAGAGLIVDLVPGGQTKGRLEYAVSEDDASIVFNFNYAF